MILHIYVSLPKGYLKQSQALWESEGVEREQILPESQRVDQNEQQPKGLTPQWFNDGGLLPGFFSNHTWMINSYFDIFLE